MVLIPAICTQNKKTFSQIKISYFSHIYRSGKVTSVTRQVISGVLYYYNVELVTEMVTKQCIIVIKDQTWIQDGATEIRINCEGDDTEIEATF